MNRIVVIEDDPAILRGLTNNLRFQSYDVLTAADGEVGYRLVREQQPDLVILDLMLPGLNGFDICRQIRGHGLATPILMLTAQNQESDRVQGFEAGADDYVTKPFSIRELLGRVRAILRRSEGRADLANQRELDEARRIQQRLMPSGIPQFSGVSIASTWLPARIAGGDYFDVLSLDHDTLGVCIADVCGKGMPAAMMMSNLQAAVKTCTSRGTPPREVCARVNRVMCENIAAQGFISFFYAVISVDRKRLIYCNAGHNPPIHCTRAGDNRPLDRGGVVLGVFRDWQYEEHEVLLSAGDRLLLYTDGVTECRDTNGDEFGMDRLADTVRRSHAGNATHLTQDILDTARGFSGGNFEDDFTVLAVMVN